MAENDDVAGSPDRGVTPPERPATDEPATVSQPVAAGPTTAAPVLKTRWRDRVWSFRALLAVALATLIIGGVGGLVVGFAAGDRHDRHDGYYGRMGPGGGMPPGWRKHHGPGWQWYGGPQPPQMTPYGAPGSPAPAPSTPSPTAPGSTG